MEDRLILPGSRHCGPPNGKAVRSRVNGGFGAALESNGSYGANSRKAGIGRTEPIMDRGLIDRSGRSASVGCPSAFEVDQPADWQLPAVMK